MSPSAEAQREEMNCSNGMDFDEALVKVAQSAVQSLGKEQLHWVLAGFNNLTSCTKSRGGKLQVFRKDAIPVAINLAKTRNRCVKPAMILMEALTSPDVGEENVRDSEETDMILTVSDHLDYFIELMKDKELPEAGLLAAKTVVNMLVNPQVWEAARMEHDIVSAFLSISSGNENQAGVDVCLMGLSHLAKFSSTRIELPTRDSAGDKTNIIQKVLFLLSVGLKDKHLENLAKDALLALDMEDEVSTPVEEKLRELMETKAFDGHSTVVGRMAIVSLMTKLREQNQNQIFITKNLILYLLVMIKETGEEMRSGLVAEDLKTLQRLAVELFCYCVKHERDKAQSVLTENESERRTLEGMLEKEGSGIQDVSQLEILEILETVIPGRSRTRITVTRLVNLANSESAQCRAKVASTLLKFVREDEQIFEMQDEGAFDALVALSEDENADTRGDALLALDLLSRIITIQTEKLTFRMLSPFLRPDCKEELKEAAACLLALVFRDARSAMVFMEGPDSLKTVLYLLERGPTNPSRRECGYGLLKLATEEDDSIRLELPSAGLVKLIKFVKSLEREEDKVFLTTVLHLLCKNGKETDVIKAEGHKFLLSSLGDNNSKEAAVRGLWILLNNPATEDAVLGLLERDPTNLSCRQCASRFLRLATEEDDSVRLELASAGLGRLIKFVMRHGTEEDKALLTTVLYLLCKNEKEAAVIEAEGHIFLVSSLGDNKSKEAAVRGLWILLNNPTTEDAVVGARFVDAAMRSINSNFASSEIALALAPTSLSSEALNEMALGLAKVSSSSKGLVEIVGCGSSEGALLSLLDRCSSIEGKGAAAAVIAKLYPKLAILVDKRRHEKLSNASSLLLKCLKETENSQLKEFLKALAVFASGEKGINSILEDRGLEYLIQHIEPGVPDSEVRRLVVQIFAEMSIVLTETTGSSLSRRILKDALVQNKIVKRLFPLPLEEDDAENLINLLKIIKNYCYAGEEARGDLGAETAVPALLEALKRNALGGNVPDVNELAVKALGQFMDDANGRKEFRTFDGITTVADVLKRNAHAEVVLSHCIFILAKVVKGSGNKGDLCIAIFGCKVLMPLKYAMFHAKSPNVKLQAVDLVHLVVLHGPTSNVCAAIFKVGMLDAVVELRQNVEECKKVTTKLLQRLRGGDGDCQNFIDRELRKLKIKL